MPARRSDRNGQLDTTGFRRKDVQLDRPLRPTAGRHASACIVGVEEVVRQRLGAQASQIDAVRRELVFDYPFPPREVVQFFRQYFGPTQIAFSRLEAAGQAAYAAEMESLWQEHNEANDGRTLVRNEYLEVVARHR